MHAQGHSFILNLCESVNQLNPPLNIRNILIYSKTQYQNIILYFPLSPDIGYCKNIYYIYYYVYLLPKIFLTTQSVGVKKNVLKVIYFLFLLCRLLCYKHNWVFIATCILNYDVVKVVTQLKLWIKIKTKVGSNVLYNCIVNENIVNIH